MGKPKSVPMGKIKIGARTVKLPANKPARIVIGVALVIAGLVGFLPIVGFWMIPLGLTVLSIDIPIVRRWRRKMTVRLGVWLKAKYPKLAKKLGFTLCTKNQTGSKTRV